MAPLVFSRELTVHADKWWSRMNFLKGFGHFFTLVFNLLNQSFKYFCSATSTNTRGERDKIEPAKLFIRLIILKPQSSSLKICSCSPSALSSQTLAQEDKFSLFHLTLAFTLQEINFHIKGILITPGSILLHVAISCFWSCPDLEVN